MSDDRESMLRSLERTASPEGPGGRAAATPWEPVFSGAPRPSQEVPQSVDAPQLPAGELVPGVKGDHGHEDALAAQQRNVGGMQLQPGGQATAAKAQGAPQPPGETVSGTKGGDHGHEGPWAPFGVLVDVKGGSGGGVQGGPAVVTQPVGGGLRITHDRQGNLLAVPIYRGSGRGVKYLPDLIPQPLLGVGVRSRVTHDRQGNLLPQYLDSKEYIRVPPQPVAQMGQDSHPRPVAQMDQTPPTAPVAPANPADPTASSGPK